MKMTMELKKLLVAEGATPETIGLIEDYYAGQFQAAAEHHAQEAGGSEKSQEKTPSITELARNARIIK